MKSKDDWTVKNLEESERLYRSTLEALDDPLHVVDRNLHLIYVNKAFVKWLHELDLDSDILGKKIHQVFNFLDETVVEEYKRVFETGETIHTTERTKIGHLTLDTETSKTPIFSEGKPIQVITVVRDITESIRLQEALQESESIHRMIFDSATDGILIHSLEGEIRAVNRVICDRLGFSRDEMLQMKPSDFDTTNHAVLPDGGLGKMREEGVVIFETEHTRRDGTKVPTEISSRVIEYDGEPAILSVARDITERVSIETRYQMLSSAISQSTEGIIILDMEGIILFCNKAFANLNGYEPEELVGENLSITHSKEQLEAVVVAGAESRERGFFSGVLWFTRKDGTVFPGRMRNTFIRDDEGEPYGYIGTLQDISAQLEADEQLTKLSRAVEQSPASVVITDADQES